MYDKSFDERSTSYKYFEIEVSGCNRIRKRFIDLDKKRIKDLIHLKSGVFWTYVRTKIHLFIYRRNSKIHRLSLYHKMTYFPGRKKKS